MVPVACRGMKQEIIDKSGGNGSFGGGSGHDEAQVVGKVKEEDLYGTSVSIKQ